MTTPARHEPIAIIGMAGRFPGAADLSEFWAGLHRGAELIRLLTEDELLAGGVAAEALADPRYVRASAAAPEIDCFDAEFFGLTPRQARICDPQARLLLECAHAALEDAGYDVERLSEVGVFGSTGPNRYLELVRRAEAADPHSAAGMALQAWNSADSAVSLVSRVLDLRGPSVAVQAGDASSLLAVHLAAAALRAGDCELAVAGGAEVQLPLGHGYRWEPGRELSRDGHCRPFDKAATGTVPASGAGVVVLKRYSDALADRDHIWAVLTASAAAHDGAATIGSGTPDRPGQGAAATRALALAGVRPAELAMLEAHATGNPAEDSREMTALAAAYRADEPEDGRCALTSVKANVGHLGHAAGVASLIKVALSLANEAIPAAVGCEHPHPSLGLDGSPFYLPAETLPWPRQAGTPRLAGVNAVGAGGANVHAVLREAPARAPLPVEERPRIVVWSARTPSAAERYRDRLAEQLATADRARFVRSAATLQQGRTAHRHRGALVAANPAEAVPLLRQPGSSGSLGEVGAPAGGRSRIAFLFPGQGAQRRRLAYDLYERWPDYADAFDACLELFEDAGVPLRRWWLEGSRPELDAPQGAVPLTFAVEYALSRTWQSWGITPSAVVGLSIGEMTAGLAAGVFALDEVVRAIAVRSQGIADLPPGGLLAVSAAREDVQPLLPAGTWIAVVTGPSHVVVSGSPDPLAEAAVVLARAGLSCRPVPTTRAAHGPIAASAVPAFDQALRELRLNPPTVDFYSANTGRLLDAAEATDPGFWSRQLVEPVLFGDALDALLATPDRLLLIEVGPGQTLTSVVRRHPAVLAGRHRVLPTLSHHPVQPLAQLRCALEALAAVWTEGHAVDWSALDDIADLGRASVPGYPYERTRHWISPPPAPVAMPADRAAADRAPDTAVPATAGTAVPGTAVPATGERLRQLWTTVLAVDDIAPGADFFDLGGNSLTAVELVTRVRAEFQLPLDVEVLFEHPTLAALAEHIERQVG